MVRARPLGPDVRLPARPRAAGSAVFPHFRFQARGCCAAGSDVAEQAPERRPESPSNGPDL